MSLKLQISYQCRHFLQFLHSLALPKWLVCARAKIIAIALILLLGVGYIFQTNKLSTSGYVIHDLEKSVISAQNEIQKIESEVAMNQSLASIQKRLPEAKMIPLSGIKYIVVDTAMAKR